jgi:hypothetical protein
MTIESMFEKAARQKIRIPCEKGWLYVEDLFDLSLKELDKIYKILNAQLKVAKEDSLLTIKDKDATKLELQVELVKYVAGVKIAEEAANAARIANKQKKEFLMTVLEEQQKDEIKKMSSDEIKKMLEEL